MNWVSFSLGILASAACLAIIGVVCYLRQYQRPPGHMILMFFICFFCISLTVVITDPLISSSRLSACVANLVVDKFMALAAAGWGLSLAVANYGMVMKS